MNCKKAGEAMLQYVDKRIKPPRAAALARHVLKCEDCRTYFVAFDAAVESVGADGSLPITETPAGFADAVMAKVRRLPAYKPSGVVSKADIAVRIFWCFCAVCMGVGLSVMYNRDVITAFIATHPQFTAVSDVYNVISRFFNVFFEQLMLLVNAQPSAQSASAANVQYTALAFVAVLAVSLFAVRRSEKYKA